MVGGLLILISKGVENNYITKYPEITFFKIAYRRYSNFSVEPVKQNFKVQPNFGKKNSVTLSNIGDLISKVYLVIELPTVMKINNDLVKFSWVKNIGFALINYIELVIDNIVIDKQYSEWMFIWNELTGSFEKNKALNKIIGNVPELYEPSNGKDSYQLHIPLNFWFCNYISNAIPIFALNKTEVKINISFNDLNNVYVQTPSHYIFIDNDFVILEKNQIIYQTVDGIENTGKFIYFDPIEKKLYYNPIKNIFKTYNDNELADNYIIYNYNNDFKIYPLKNNNSNIFVYKVNNYFSNIVEPSITNSFFLVDYIYLDPIERKHILLNDQEYLIETIQFVPPKITGANYISIKMDLINQISQIVWVVQMLYNKNNNDHFNYSDNGDLIYKNAKIIINGQNLFDEKSSEFFNYLLPYNSYSNSPNNGINVYNFGIYPEISQPSGSMNMSMVDDIKLDLRFNKVVNNNNKVCIKVFAKSYNILKISKNYGNIVFSNN